MPNGVSFCTGFRDLWTQLCFFNASSPIQVSSSPAWASDSTGSNLFQEQSGVVLRSGIKTDGTLWLWGYNSQGQVGDNTRVSKSSPVQTVAGGNTWKSTSSNSLHTTAIKTDGTLWLWGNNGQGQLGDNTVASRSSPIQTISGGTNWKQVSAGQNHTVAIKTDGTAWDWGCFLSLSRSAIEVTNRKTPGSLGGTTWSQAAAGRFHSVAIKTDGTLWTWGQNNYGVLGDNTTTYRLSPVQTIAGGTNWCIASTGGDVVAAAKTDGTLWLWGRNNYGVLGNNASTTFSGLSSPVQTIAGGTNWKQPCVFTGGFSVGAVKTDGTLWAWGSNAGNDLGDTTNISRSSPVQTAAGGTNWRQINGNNALKTDGTLWAWGSFSCTGIGLACTTCDVVADMGTQLIEKDYLIDAYPNLIPPQKASSLWVWGNGDFGIFGAPYAACCLRSSPIQTVAGGTNWRSLNFGSTHAVALKTDSTLWMWGTSFSGEMGNNATAFNTLSPVQTITGGCWLQAAAGCIHTAAIKSDNTLWLWGCNNFGVLGDNTSASRSSPVQTIAGGTNWKQVSAGSSQTAAIKTDGTLWTWGLGAGGRLGNNNSANLSSPVQTIAGGTNWKQVVVGSCFAGAIKTDGTLWLWGTNTCGVLGTYATPYIFPGVSSPVQTVAGGTNWKQLALNHVHVAATKTDGTLWVWGGNSAGALGNNAVTPKSSPVQTAIGGTNWKQPAVGCNHMMATKTDGTLWTWGLNSSGELGINTSAPVSIPVQTVSGGTNWKSVTTSRWHAGAIKEEGDW